MDNIASVATSGGSASRLSRMLFIIFSYFDHLAFLVLNVMPPFIRWLYFKVMCKRFGRRVLLDYDTYIRYPHKVSVGNDVSINRGCRIYASFKHKTAMITIQDHVMLGPQVTFFGAGHDPESPHLDDVAASIVVGHGTYIGGNSTVRYGVTIGENCVIAAGSMVVSDIPANTIAAGVPAHVVSARTVR